MVIGMGVVFLILVFLVLAVSISTKIIHALEGPPGADSSPVSPQIKDRTPISAIIAAAVSKFRRGNR